jgi:hypothetical protein
MVWKLSQLTSRKILKQKKLSIEIEYKLPNFFYFKFPLGFAEYTYQRVLLTYLLSPEANWYSSSLRNSPHFMELEGSLLHSQVPTTVPILSLLDPIHTPHPTSWRSILILFSYLCLGLRSDFFLSGFPNKALYKPLFSPICVTLLESIWWNKTGKKGK